MKKSARLLMLLLVFALVLAGCGGAAAPEKPAVAPTEPPAAPAAEQPTAAPRAAEPTALPPTEAPPAPPKLKVVTLDKGANDPQSIDPQRAVNARDLELETALFPPLVLTSIETNQMAPGMAKSWDISEDGKVYTFHLLEKVPWVRYNADTGAVEEVKDEQGQVRYVTAKDFAYGFIRALDPAVGSWASYILAPNIVGAADFNAGTGSADKVGVKAVDDYTFEITAPEKLSYLLGIYGIISARATPEWAIEANGDVWTEPNNINTFGPFALKEWAHESSMTFVKNPFWPGSEGIQQPKLDEVTFRFIDTATALREFEAGSLDTALIPADQVKRIQADAALGPQLTVIPGTCTQAWGFNAHKPPFDNAHIRRAFSYAVDRETLVKDVLGAGQVAARFYTPPGIALAPSAAKENATLGMAFDEAKAKEELALGLKDLNLESVDQLPPITVEFGTGTELTAVSQALQAMWQKTLGVQVTLQQVDNTVYWSKQEKDAGQIFRAGWCPDYNDTSNYLYDVYRSDSINNYGKATTPDYDKLVDQARVETDPAVRLKLYTEAEQFLNVDYAGTMSLYYPAVPTLTKPTLKRSFSPFQVDYFWDWDLTE